MTDRDTFAAAALTGLLANNYFSLGDEAAKRCYQYADAMLRERERTNHDAAPAAKARTDSASCGRGCDGTDKPVTLPAVGTGDICERLRRWFKDVNAVPATDLMDEAATEIEVQRACTSAARAEFARLRLTDEEREAVAYYSDYGETPGEASRAATLRSLLARLA
jgi:hypothetical protein